MSIVIVDYQMGNLRSVQKGLEFVGHEATVSSDPEVIAKAQKLILPGVGAFKDAMRELSARSLPEVLKEAIQAGKPFLGICLGLQLLFETGYENGEHQGLGVLEGTVERFPDRGLKVPHMGWNQVELRQPECPLLENVPETAHFYFVHSYFVKPARPEVVLLDSHYGDSFCAAIRRDNLFATQFHPEKSQSDGLKILENFANL